MKTYMGDIVTWTTNFEVESVSITLLLVTKFNVIGELILFNITSLLVHFIFTDCAGHPTLRNLVEKKIIEHNEE